MSVYFIINGVEETNLKNRKKKNGNPEMKFLTLNFTHPTAEYFLFHESYKYEEETSNY